MSHRVSHSRARTGRVTFSAHRRLRCPSPSPRRSLRLARRLVRPPTRTACAATGTNTHADRHTSADTTEAGRRCAHLGRTTRATLTSAERLMTTWQHRGKRHLGKNHISRRTTIVPYLSHAYLLCIRSIVACSRLQRRLVGFPWRSHLLTRSFARSVVDHDDASRPGPAPCGESISWCTAARCRRSLPLIVQLSPSAVGSVDGPAAAAAEPPLCGEELGAKSAFHPLSPGLWVASCTPS